MMYYPQELIEEIRMQNDIVDVVSQYVKLMPKGSSHFGLCPFHHEKTPSFSVDRDKQMYYCFGCGAAGNVYSFLMQMENCDFPEAVKRLADRAHITLPEKELSAQAKEEARQKQRLYQLHSSAGRFYYEMLQSPRGEAAREYLKNRQMLPQIQKKFGIGYAPSGRTLLMEHLQAEGYSLREMLDSGLVMPNKDGSGYHDRFYDRLMFPIIDVQGRVIAFGGRVLSKGEPKYLNSPETKIFSKRRQLFGLNFAKNAKRKELILVEGYMDMISIYQAGFHHVAASLGTAFHADHAKLMKKYVQDVILLYDSDEAGTNAALRAIPVLVKNGLRVKVTQVPDGKDPDEFLRHNGAQAFAKLLVDAVHYVSFQISCIQKKYDLNDAEHRVRFTVEAAQALAQIENEIERNVFVGEVARLSGVDTAAISREIEKLRQKEDTDSRPLLHEGRAFAKKEIPYSEKGLLEAQKDILLYCADHKEGYLKMREILTAEDFTDETCRQAFYVLEGLWEKAGVIYPAELTGFFEEIEQQQMIAAIFASAVPKESRADQEKALNEEIKLLKRHRLDKQISKCTSAEELQNLLAQKRRVEQLYITILYG